MSGQVNIKNLTGLQGGVVMRGVQVESGRFHALQAIDATTIGAVVGNLDQTTSSLAGQIIPAGLVIYGDFSQVGITAGTLIAYSK